MQRFFIAILFVFLSSTFWGQFQNAGFEEYSSIPNTTGQWYYADAWTNAGGLMSSPDYYHYFGSGGGDIPETPVAEVNAYEGNAIMGLSLTGKLGMNKREYLSTEMAAPLEVGQEYFVSFRITNGYASDLSNAGLAVNKLGVLFSNDEPTQTTEEPLLLNPQFEIDTVLYSREWMNVNFTFVATDVFRHMTVGVFKEDSDVIFEIEEGDNPSVSYYFFDDFIIERMDDSFDPAQADKDKGGNANDPTPDIPPRSNLEDVDMSSMPFFIPNAFTPNGDGDNDYFKPLSRDNNSYKLTVFNRWGEVLYSGDQEHIGWNGSFRGEPAETGTYIWSIEYMDESRDEKLKTQFMDGAVYLIR